MDYIAIVFTKICFSFLVSLAVIVYMRENFKTVFIDICGSEARAGFWAGFCNLCIAFVPLIFTLFSLSAPEKEHSILYELLRTFRWALIGLMAMVGTIGLVLSSFANEKK